MYRTKNGRSGLLITVTACCGNGYGRSTVLGEHRSRGSRCSSHVLYVSHWAELQAGLDEPVWAHTEDSNQTRLIRSLRSPAMSGLEPTWPQTAAKGGTLPDVTAGLFLRPPGGNTGVPAAECGAELRMQAAGCNPWPVLVATWPKYTDSQAPAVQRQAVLIWAS